MKYTIQKQEEEFHGRHTFQFVDYTWEEGDRDTIMKHEDFLGWEYERLEKLHSESDVFEYFNRMSDTEFFGYIEEAYTLDELLHYFFN